MKRKELLIACEELIQSFDPAKTTVDAHATEKLAALSSLTDQLFLQQVLYGSYRYRDILRPLLTLFFATYGNQVHSRDYTMLLIMGYLALFRLEELGPFEFTAFARALPSSSSISLFLSYLFNPENLRGALHAQWIRLLDTSFVESEIIDKMLRFKPEIDTFMTPFHTKDVATLKKPLTIPVAPNLTQIKPRRVQEPLRIARHVKAKPVPFSLQKLSLADLQAQTEARKEQSKAYVVKKYESVSAFQFATSARKSNLEAVRDQVERERDAALHFEFKAKPVPRASTAAANPIEIKLTTAAILREDALYQRQKERDAARLRAYESELRDSFDFYRWQTKMHEQDEAAGRIELEARRLEMVQASYQAIEAAQQAKLENRDVALEMKEQAKTRAAERHDQESARVEKMRQLTDEIKRVRETAPREAEAHVRQENARQRDALQDFLVAERARKAEQEAKELAAREDLIRQIRALDRVQRERVAAYDPTETAQWGLLEEMSLTELHERLRMRQEEQKRVEDRKRETILHDKQQKQVTLVKKADDARRRRQATASANAAARNDKKARAAAREQAVHSLRRKNNLQLAAKLEQQGEKRMQEMEQLRVENEEKATTRHLVGAGKTRLEEEQFHQLECGFARMAKTRQATNQIDALTREQVRLQHKRMMSKWQHASRLATLNDEQARMAMYSRAKEDARQRNQQEDETLRALVRHEQQRVAYVREAASHAGHCNATKQPHKTTGYDVSGTKPLSKPLPRNRSQDFQVAAT